MQVWAGAQKTEGRALTPLDHGGNGGGNREAGGTTEASTNHGKGTGEAIEKQAGPQRQPF